MKTKYKQQVVVGMDDSGKRIRKWAYGNTKVELAQNIAELKEQYAFIIASADMTFGEYARRWKKTYKDNLEANTVEMYDNALKKLELIYHIPLNKVVESDLQMVINENWEHAETCRKVKMTMNEIFKRAIKDKLLEDNPATDLQLPKIVHKQKYPLSDQCKDVIRKLISVKSNTLCDRNKMFLAIEYYFGLRPEETRALTSTDFKNNLSELTISKASAFKGETPHIKGTKTENVRIMPVPDAFKPLLKNYLKNLNGLYLFTLLGSKELVTKSANTKMWKNIKDAINEGMGGNENLNVLGDNFTTYILRRNYCTNLYYSGISIKKAAYLMGHANTKMVLEVYAQLDDERENLQAIREII